METNKAKTSARDAKSGSGGRDSTSGGGADMKGQAAEVLGHAQDQASSIVGMASQQATSQLGTQKDRAASTLGAVATALHEASRQMRQQDETAIAGYIDSAAGQVEHLSTMLREQDINQIIDTTAQFARRQPALFLAAAFAVGFAGTRFLKSSSSSQGQSWSRTNSEASHDWNRSRPDAYAPGKYGSGYGVPAAPGGPGYAGTAGAGMNTGMDAASGFGTAAGSSRATGAGTQGASSSTTGAPAGSSWSARDRSSLGPEGS